MARHKRQADQAVLRRLRYTINTLENALHEYEGCALPNTLVMAELNKSEQVIKSVQADLRNRL